VAFAMSDTKFSKSELKVQTIARRRAIKQLMHVPCSRFCRAYEEYPHWQALALWTQAIIDCQNSVPPWLVAVLKRHCPGFLENVLPSLEANLVPLQLLSWVHQHEFGYAKREGWLDALTFYGVRHPRSKCAWAYWEYCEKEWQQRPPSSYPDFEDWVRSAQDRIESTEKQRDNGCQEEPMATNKAAEALLETYLSFVDHESALVHAFRKTPGVATRSKLIGELKSLNSKRLEILDQVSCLLKS
jgi:hypothetical protein